MFQEFEADQWNLEFLKDFNVYFIEKTFLANTEPTRFPHVQAIHANCQANLSCIEKQLGLYRKFWKIVFIFRIFEELFAQIIPTATADSL